MSFRKPYRICNAVVPGMQDPVAGADRGIKSALKELKDRYELRIWIPGSGKRHYAVSIAGGILYVHGEGGNNRTVPQDMLACFLLPANVVQEKVTGFYRQYGLKLVMPMALQPGSVIRVPLLQETPVAKAGK